MLLLKTILDQPSGNDDLRTYQRDRWGRVSNAETCVIELCGLAARGVIKQLLADKLDPLSPEGLSVH